MAFNIRSASCIRSARNELTETFWSSIRSTSRPWASSYRFSPRPFVPIHAVWNGRCSTPAFQTAAFHTTSPRSILPTLPQVVIGTANDPAPVPQPSPTHGSYHWTFERLASAALVPLVIAPFASGSLNPIMDAVFCATILIHSHIGFQSIIIDYIPTKRLPRTRALFWWGLRGATLIVAIGLYEFETNDVGITEAVKMIWSA